MAVRSTTKKLYSSIRQDYATLVAENKYRTEYIIQKLAEKYFKSTTTIENIVYTKSQL